MSVKKTPHPFKKNLNCGGGDRWCCHLSSQAEFPSLGDVPLALNPNAMCYESWLLKWIKTIARITFINRTFSQAFPNV